MPNHCSLYKTKDQDSQTCSCFMHETNCLSHTGKTLPAGKMLETIPREEILQHNVATCEISCHTAYKLSVKKKEKKKKETQFKM